MFGGGFNAVIGTSYTAEDEDIISADTDYTALESQLAARIANIESEYGGYDEYRYSLDEIGHDPFELASYLTAKFNAYTREQVQAELSALFAQQYILTLTPVTEVRYRTETRTGTSSWTLMGADKTEAEPIYSRRGKPRRHEPEATPDAGTPDGDTETTTTNFESEGMNHEE